MDQRETEGKMVYPRTIERPDGLHAYIIEEDQIDTVMLPVFAPGIDIPFSELIDDEGRIHFEYTHCVWSSAKEKRHPIKLIRWFFDPRAYYFQLAPSIVAGSLIGTERRLIGGGTGIFYTRENDVFCPTWGLLLREQLVERGIDPEVRKGVADRLTVAFERFARRLGARRVLGVAAVAPSQRAMERNGWKPIPRIPFHESWKLFWGTFPISIRMKSTYYQKPLT